MELMTWRYRHYRNRWKSTPNASRVGVRWAAIYLRQEDWVYAGEMLIRYLELAPDHAPSHFGLALSFDNLGNYEQALLHYNKFIELDRWKRRCPIFPSAPKGPSPLRTFSIKTRNLCLLKSLVAVLLLFSLAACSGRPNVFSEPRDERLRRLDEERVQTRSDHRSRRPDAASDPNIRLVDQLP